MALNTRSFGMTSVRPGTAALASFRIAVAAAAVLGVAAPQSRANIFVTGGDPPAPPAPLVFTADAGPPGTPGTGSRGIDALRRLRQTFKNPTTFDVGQVFLGFDVTSGVGGLTVSIYEVEDVNAGTWTPGNLVHSFQYFNNLPGSTGRLKFDLTGSDVFSLAARNAGTNGYGLELSNVDNVSNPGQIVHTSAAAVDPDLYLDGRYYTETGGGNANRDFGVWLLGSDPNIPGPGDVNGIGGVTIDDLNIIAGRFRQTGTRAQGDLTGDGFVDIADFREWKANFPGANSGAGGFEGLFGVPEPATAVLLVVG